MLHLPAYEPEVTNKIIRLLRLMYCAVIQFITPPPPLHKKVWIIFKHFATKSELLAYTWLVNYLV
jgi:hypothetical protein